MSPSFEILPETERHPEGLDELVREYPHISGTKFHDLHIAAVMREHVITENRTADTDFHQFKFLRVTNPVLSKNPNQEDGGGPERESCL